MKTKPKTMKDLERVLAEALLLVEEIKSSPGECVECSLNKRSHRFKLFLVEGGQAIENFDDKVRRGLSSDEV